MCDGVRLHAEAEPDAARRLYARTKTRRPQVVMIVMPTVMHPPSLANGPDLSTKSPAPKKKKP